MAYQPPTINLDNSILEGPYASYFNSQITSIKDELKTIKSLLNCLSTPQTIVNASESVINKLRQENDSLRRELIAEKERSNGLEEERESLKLLKLVSNDPHDWANFKRMRNKVNTEIKAAKELFYNNKFKTNGDPRKTWQIIHDLTSRKAVNLSIREINLNGTSISGSCDLSNAFNDHFSSIGPKLANDIPLSNNNDHCHRKYVKGINNRFEFRPTDSGQSLNGLAPNYLSSKFIRRSDVNTSYNLRDSDNKLAIPLPCTNHYKNSFAYSGVVLWNSLPSAARQATSLTNFRRFLINSDTAFM
ncbi:unnamed protein product [Porites evermanni]|uniref:Uncharacterized protein n=1 Tax=Porites evermanni TaxID=104178 RepID=A0ABN8SLU1_9CNID|nr:unnamed protein product [Porites evermanni]